MRNPLAMVCRRRKLLAGTARAVSPAMYLSALLALSSHAVFAQSADQNVAPPASASLPRAFAQFSAGDVLKQIFGDYDSKTGRVAGVQNLEGKPALVVLNKAALWKVQGQEHLVVLVDIAGDDEVTGLCGNCFANSFLAVLKKNGAALSLVAKQLTLPPSKAPVGYESLDEDQLIQYSGHDEITLDLAPYKLDGRETLIGVRLEHIWLPALEWSTSLTLYRIRGGRLVEVFGAPVVERVYSDAKGDNAATIEKTTSTISLLPASRGGGEFNDLVINKIVVRCPSKHPGDDCDSRRAGFKQIKSQTELWRFDGLRYAQITPDKR